MGAIPLFAVPEQETVATPVEVTKFEMNKAISDEPYSTHCYFTSKKANNWKVFAQAEQLGQAVPEVGIFYVCVSVGEGRAAAEAAK